MGVWICAVEQQARVVKFLCACLSQESLASLGGTS